MTGVFIVFEGGDGVGKSTQIDATAAWLRETYPSRELVLAREPGGTEMGRDLRQVILHGSYVAPKAEALLYAADRAHNIAMVVRPALDRDAIVVQDRYIDSSIAYQGGARELGADVERINTWATGGLLPHLTVILDMHAGDDRLERNLDRVETDMIQRRERIRQEFRDRATLDPGRYAVVEASRSVAEVQAEVRAAIAATLAALGAGDASDPGSVARSRADEEPATS